MIISSKHSIGIIGGEGKTGRQFAQIFRSLGFKVCVTGAKTRHRNRELINTCDMVMFSVPLSKAAEIIREELTTATRADQLVLDLSSLKAHEVEALKTSRGESIGMHPLFGPSTSPDGETVILCPGHAKKETINSLRSVLSGVGLKTIVMTAEEHDRLMATVQVIPHLKSFLMADVLLATGTDLSKVLKTCTPTYELEFNVIARFLDDHPDLYMPIIFRNPETIGILESLHATIGSYLQIAKKGDLKTAEKRYHALRRFFGPFLTRARKRSEACIRTLSTFS